jgi:Ca2+-binding EF-hand superfamily protein
MNLKSAMLIVVVVLVVAAGGIGWHIWRSSLTRPAAVAPPSDKAQADARAKAWFTPHDRDRDGFVTVDEVIGYESKVFMRMDLDGDGRISADEFVTGIPPELVERYRKRFAEMDANGDGYLTLDEVNGYYRRSLAAADRNGDGKISLDEWLAFARDKF